MRLMTIIGIQLIFLLFSKSVVAAEQETSWSVLIVWKEGGQKGSIMVRNGHISEIKMIRGKGKISGHQFRVTSSGETHLRITLDSVQNISGPPGSILTVKTESDAFSFFTRDVSENHPIYIPEYGVAVLPGSAGMDYASVAASVSRKNLRTKIASINAGDEVDFERAAAQTRNMSVPTWLGTGRDIRIFQYEESLPDAPKEGTVIVPMNASSNVTLPFLENKAVQYSFVAGRGIGPFSNTTRRLEDGVLPIIHSEMMDDEVRYRTIAFATRERTALRNGDSIGTHYLVADQYSYGHMFTPEQQKQVDMEMKKFSSLDEQQLLMSRTTAENTGKVPRYAWFKTIRPGRRWWDRYSYNFDSDKGISYFDSLHVFAVSRLNGQPLVNEEIAVLLQPGEKVTFEFSLLHFPVSMARAEELVHVSFDDKLAECRGFWNSKLDQASRIRLPEKRIEEMIRAGLVHLDLVTYGKEPGGTLAPCIGVYSPIGTESSPIIQFYNSMGLHETAKRSLQYFLDKQRPDGMIQNFGGYMVETGAALWSMGEYFRYTRDTAWVRKNKSAFLKSADFLIAWRNRNKLPSLVKKGYGMIDGKVADPEDHFHQYTLNAYAYLGLSRMAGILAVVDKNEGERLQTEASAWKYDIRTSFFEAMALSPVVPLGNGHWVPTSPPWTEASGPRALYLEKERFYSHGTFTVSDAMLGPMYLIFCEVLSPDEQAARFLHDYHSELFYQRNSAFSQPYYSRHDYVQAKRGMVKPYLDMYYTTMSGLADRETYTFWEHYYKVSVHKTHEEAWFLMQTRWMLYLEDNDTLRLFSTAPRKWFRAGGEIRLDRVSSYFGPLDVSVKPSAGSITATVTCKSERAPRVVQFRLPHPQGKKPVKIKGGDWNPENETVTVTDFSGETHITLEY